MTCKPSPWHIQSDSSPSHALVELVREACANATRHGEATSIEISVTLGDQDRAIELAFGNDGLPLPAHPKLGIGSQLFDEQTLSWSRTQEGDTVRVTARLPLATHPASSAITRM